MTQLHFDHCNVKKAKEITLLVEDTYYAGSGARLNQTKSIGVVLNSLFFGIHYSGWTNEFDYPKILWSIGQMVS